MLARLAETQRQLQDAQNQLEQTQKQLRDAVEPSEGPACAT
jgi:hypothetical protein